MTKPSNRDTSRRGFLHASTLSVVGAGATVLGGVSAQAQAPVAPERSPTPAAGLNTPAAAGSIFHIARTAYGRVQGIENAGIKSFKGVPYGAPTGGRNRFMPPKKPAAWTGVRECFSWGGVCPQTPSDLRSDYGQMIMWDRHVGDGPMGEDCLVLNVWTPGVDRARRAVLVSFHGGGWTTGSGNFPGFDGHQLARYGDVVVVTVCYRLASYGYTHLADLGAPPEFAYAGVTGVMDMTASLEWVRDNIAEFGGDPSRVMIFGQSGGGAKTSTLLGTPAAKGLFHRAAVQSGSALRLATRERATRSAEMLLAELGLTKGRIADLQKASWQQLLVAQTAATAKGASFSPVKDGRYLPHDPFDPTAPGESADVPIIVSTTLEDAALRLTNFDLDEAGLTRVLDQRFTGRGAEIARLYRRNAPRKTAYLLQAQALTDSGARRAAERQVELKHAQGRAPAYLYLWSWPSPAYDGKFGAVHGVDVSASFHAYRDQSVGSGDARGRKMCDRLASTWVAFAKTGDPNNPEIPRWEPYDPQTRPTMVFDDDTRLERDPRSEIRKYWAGQPPPSPQG